jgi:hypothetical protein
MRYIATFVFESGSDTRAEFDFQCMGEAFCNNLHSALDVANLKRVDGEGREQKLEHISYLRPEDLSETITVNELREANIQPLFPKDVA